jgi:catechol 2,3-dioxygenase-like lactoylglutathione lyase family enzyme
MATPYQITIDCADPSALAEFWVNALGFTFVNPPDGFSNWEGWLEAAGVPEEEWDPGRRPYNKIVDPEGGGLRIWFQRVPEPKTAKNRLHLDLRASGDPTAPLGQRKKQVDAEAARLVVLGAHRHAEYELEDHYHVVMQDPEGNEFCLT